MYKTKTSNCLNYNPTLQNLYHFPKLEGNLTSVKKITDKDFFLYFWQCFVERDNEICLKQITDGNNFYKAVLCNNEATECNENNLVFNCVSKNCLTLWPRHFCL